jgi:hypothetical protein
MFNRFYFDAIIEIVYYDVDIVDQETGRDIT